MKKFLCYSSYIISTVVLTITYNNVDPSTPILAFFFASFVSLGWPMIILGIYQLKWRYDNGVDLFAILETDEEKLKNHMLYIMRYHAIEKNFNELNDIFRNYPQWNLKNWVVFRSWYKAQIDHMIKYPDIYGLTMKTTGEPYDSTKDPLYDPEAPDWDQFDRPYYDDDDDDFEDDDFENYNNNDNNNKTDDAFAVGIGIGIVNGLTGGSVLGGGTGGN